MDEEALDAIAIGATEISIQVEKRRYGKPVTVVDGFGPEVDVDRIARALKRRLGAGGGAKNGRLELQGNHAPRLATLLREMGFLVG